MDAAEQCSAYQRPIANDRVAQTVKGGENLFWIVRLGTPRESGAHPVGMCDKDPENVSLVAAQIYLVLLTYLGGSLLGKLAPSTDVTLLFSNPQMARAWPAKLQTASIRRRIVRAFQSS